MLKKEIPFFFSVLAMILIPLLIYLIINPKALLVKGGGQDDDRKCGFPNVYRDLGFLPPVQPSTYQSWVSVPVRSEHQSFFEKVFSLVAKKGLFFNEVRDWDPQSYKYHKLERLRKMFNVTLNTGYGEAEEHLHLYLYTILDLSPKVSHPMYLSKGGNGLDPYAIVGDLIATTVNSVVETYIYAPAAVHMEVTFVKKLLSLLGYAQGDGDGVLTQGPDHANIMAITAALPEKFPGYKSRGMSGLEGSKFSIFVPATYQKVIEHVRIITGIPESCVVPVPVSNVTGRMIVEELEIAIDKTSRAGGVAAMVIATVGSEFSSAIDELSKIAEVTRRKQIWFHVDASVGGGILLSERHKRRLKGIEDADSVTLGLEKIMSSPVSSTFLLTKKAGILEDSLRNYFQATLDISSLSPNLGERMLQTSRRQDIFKVWYAWKSKGKQGILLHVERLYQSLNYAMGQLKENPKFRFLQEVPDLPVIFFYYVPAKAQGMGENSPEYYKEVNEFNIKFKLALLRKEGIYISSSPHPDPEKPFVVLSVGLYNSALTKPHINNIAAQMGHTAASLELLDEPQTEQNTTVDIKKYPAIKIKHASMVSAPVKRLHRDFYVEVMDLVIRKGLFFQYRQCEAPVRILFPNELERVIDPDLDQEEGMGQEGMLDEIRRIMRYTGHQSHPMYMVHTLGGLDRYAIVADYVTSIVNNPMTGFEDSPLPCLMEEEVLNVTRSLIGYPGGEGDGAVTDGAFMANSLAIGIARYKKIHQGKQNSSEDISEKEFVFYSSDHAHNGSFEKSCTALGMGIENCVPVKTDKNGRMLVSELRAEINKSIEAGKIPIGVAATAGTAVLGAIDPIDEIATLCEQLGLHLHVDGTYGGALAWSDKNKDRIKGVERSHSFTVSFHQTFNAPHVATILVTKEPGIMKKAFANTQNSNGSALGIPEAYENLGNNPFMKRTHRASVVKIWFTWKARGTQGLGAHVDYIFERSRHMLKKIKASPSFEPVLQEFDLFTICFYYIPPKLQGKEKNEEFWTEVDTIAKTLYALLVRKGVLNIVAQNHPATEAAFFKAPIVSSALTNSNVDYLLRIIEHFGKDL